MCIFVCMQVPFCVYFKNTDGQMIALRKIFVWPGQARRESVGRTMGMGQVCVDANESHISDKMS